MMKAVVNVTKPKNIKTSVSLNPIMIDGTGMCGCCRVSVDGKLNLLVLMVLILMDFKLILMN